METLQEFLTHTKGVSYLVAAAFLVGFVPFWLWLTERDRKRR